MVGVCVIIPRKAREVPNHSLTSIRSSLVRGLSCGIRWRNLHDVVLSSRLGLVHTRRHHSGYRLAEVCSSRNNRYKTLRYLYYHCRRICHDRTESV